MFNDEGQSEPSSCQPGAERPSPHLGSAATANSPCVHHLFEAQVLRSPKALAVDSPQGVLTYEELNSQANQISRYLVARGVGRNSVVGICINRSPQLIAAIYGVLKAGAAYAPLDLSYPQERLTYMAQTARLELILTNRAQLSAAKCWNEADCVAVEEAWPEITQLGGENPANDTRGADLIYVIYTSGSTGRPKGVAMVHQAISNLVQWQTRRSQSLPYPARTLQFASLSFDVSAQEIFATTCSGGTLVLMNEALRYDSPSLWNYLIEQRIHRLFLPFIALQQLAEVASESTKLPTTLREVITAGEQLQITPLVRALFLRLPATSLDNQYGPSETHVATAHLLPTDASSWESLPPIGQAIDGTELHLLDSQTHPVPEGQPGELFIGGICLAQGYLHQPELTAQRFVSVTFPSVHAPRRLYRTGDLAQRLPEGGLRFLGRADNQVKIRGFRVELGEIETVVGSMPPIKECVVVAQGDGAERSLVAYVVPASGQSVTLAELREFARSRLADYMLPSQLVTLTSFPLTPSGKVDRRVLATLSPADTCLHGTQNSPPFPPPAAGEALVKAAWESVLGHSRFSLEDNFFEVGGHSLLLAKLQKGIQNSLGVQIPILSLLQHTSVASQASLAAVLSSTPGAVGCSIPLPQAPAPDLRSSGPDIAIIGMSGRFPGAEGVSQLWTKICQGTECITQFSDEELLKAGANPDDLENPAFVRARGILENPEMFDAPFFGLTPRDAELTDPQHRLFLECAWETFESAGYVPDSIQGRVGVYAGSSLNTYFLAHVLQNQQSISEFARSFQVDRYPLLVGNDKDYLATRVAYKFDLRGPAITIQTACSTSLVAVVQACGALQSHQCDVALAGGVSISFPQQRGYIYEEGAIASSEGRCRAFDARATGTVFGAGAGAVLLKRLSDALRDRDPIVAVIKGVGINNDGRDKASFSAPSIAGQTEVIRTALAQAGVSPDGIGYVEAHGTGTPLGDPIEVKALSQAFRQSTQRAQFCALGAVKTNIGHLEAAAGVTGLIKAALAVKHALIPPTLHFTRPNPLCELERSPFYVPTELMPWPPEMVPRRAGVSSFGVGGTNAHVILEQAPVEIPTPDVRSPQLLTISARSESASLATSARLAAFLQQRLDSNSAGDLRLDDIAYTLQTGRRAFRHRRGITASTLEEAVQKLNAPLRHDGSSPVAEERPPEVVFLFPGQGGQYAGMGAELYDNEPIFRQAVDRCAAILPGALWTELRVILLAKDAVSQERATSSFTETRLTQPALFITEYALAQLWISWGIRPAAVIGHSVGEFVAAVLADSFTLDDALSLVVERARLMQSLPEGAMLAVRRGADAIAPLLPPGSFIAAYNSPSLCTVSGPDSVLQAFAGLLQARRIACKRLTGSHAFHSSMMDPMVKPFTELVRSVKRSAPTLPWISTCTGGWMTAADLEDPTYWARQLRQPVQFQEAIGLAYKTKYRVVVEVGPGEALTTFARQHPAKPPNLLGVSGLVQGSGQAQESLEMMQGLGALWTAGCAPDWEAFQGGKLRRRVSLPTYPFERQRYWIEPAAVVTKAPVASLRSPEESPSPPRPESLGHSPPPVMHIPTTLAKPAAARAEHLARLIRELILEVSGTTLTDDTVSFLELGLDSLFLTQASQALRSKFGIKITFRQLLESSSSVQELSAYLDQQLPPEAFRPEVETIPAAASNPVSTTLDDSSVAMAFSLSKTAEDTGESRLSRVQQVYLAQFIDRYTQRTAKSKALTQQYRPWYADPRTASSFKRLWKEMVYQIVVSRSAGAYLWDIDGNRYIDLLNGFGPNFLGHSSQIINEALKAQIDRGIEVGPQSPLAGETAKMFCELTGNERASFVNTGSEAVYAAMRLARAVTGKDKIVIFAKDYHGNFDEVLARAGGSVSHPITLPVAAGIPKRAVQDMIVLEYGSPVALDVISSRADEIAAVMVEPVQSRRPEFQPFQFIRDLRRLTEQKRIALIFDEVITGVRHRPDGAQGLYGVEADVATYGKVVGGGMPIGIVAGKAEYMDIFDGGFWQYGDDSFPEKGATFFAGTFVRHPLAIAATHAMLKYLLQQPPEFWDTINGRTARLASSVDSFFVQHDIPIRMPHCCSQMFVRVPDELEFGNLLFSQLRHRGVFILENFPTYMTAAHTDQDVDEIIQAFKDSAQELMEAGFLKRAF